MARNYFTRLRGMAEHMRRKFEEEHQQEEQPSVTGKAVPQAAVA